MNFRTGIFVVTQNPIENIMRKILTFSLLAVTLLFSACAGSDSPEAVAKKIEKKESLSQKDYSVMIDYLSDAFKDLNEAFRKGELDNKEWQSKFEKKYSHAETFMMQLMQAEDLDKENKAKMKTLEDEVDKFYSSISPSSGANPDGGFGNELQEMDEAVSAEEAGAE